MNSKETIAVDDTGERRTNSAWIGVLVALIVLAVLFFIFSGFNLPGTSRGTTNIPTTQTVAPSPTTTSK